MPTTAMHSMVAPRRRSALCWFWMFALFIATPAVLHAKEDRPDAKHGFARIQAPATPTTDEALEPYFPASLVERLLRGDAEKILAWRRAYHQRLGGARVLKVQQKGDDALVRCKVPEPASEIVVPLRWDGSRWVVNAPREYTTQGETLKAVNGAKPARLRLTARTTNGPYGTSAFSFAHVTQDPGQCLNRMDLWYCHNGDLHILGEGSAAEIGKTSLRRVSGIPLEANWERTVKPERGRIYLLHAKRDGHRDFYVRFKVRALKPDFVEVDWEIHALGAGSPPNTQEAHPLVSNDGTDGTAGLCGRSR